MFSILDFDIYSKRISFFFNKRDKIGTFFGLILTFLYLLITLILFLFYLIRTIKRIEVKTHESTIYSQGLPSIDINPHLLYFAFGLENPHLLTRFIDEQIYYPKVFFIKQQKEKGILVTKEIINLNVERCNIKKFGREYENQFTEGELNNSYCLQDFSLSLVGGSKYEQSSFIQIKVHPCVNNTRNNIICKPQNIIDSYLTSGYFSMTIKDIGLNPSNYSFPIIPTIQYLKTNVDITMCRESLIYLGITEIQTDEGLFTNSIKTEHFLQYRKYSQSFFFINETEYHNGKEIFGGQIKLEEYIYVQKREYIKMAEVFSITGGYMQLMSTIFLFITIFTKNIHIEKKIVNKLFNFNLKQKKIILSIHYQKRFNYVVHNKNGYINSFIPYKPKKESIYPFIEFYLKMNNDSKNNNIFIWKTNNLNHIKNKCFSSKNNTVQNNIKYSFPKKNSNQIDLNSKTDNSKIMNSINIKEPNNIDKSNMLMLFKNEEINDSQINKLFWKNNSKEGKKSNKDLKFNESEKDLVTNIDFNLFDYFCGWVKQRNNKVGEIELFHFGIDFYKNQMNIINIFNLIFLAKILITHHANKKKNILNQIIEIPKKSL